ncbi:HEAT repeat domain-containing protein [Candidatus Riflebacteria bacterium]
MKKTNKIIKISLAQMNKKIKEQLFLKNSEEQVKGLQGLINLRDKEELEENIVQRVQELVGSRDGAVHFFSRKLLNQYKITITGEQTPYLEALPGLGKIEDSPVRDPVLIFSSMDFSRPAEIIKCFENPDIQRFDLAFFKGIFDSSLEEYIPHLLEYLNKSTNNIHISFLVKHLGCYQKPELLDVIKKFLTHSDNRVVANAVEGLELLGDPRAIPLFSQLLRHKNNRVVANAAKALNEGDPRTVKPILKKMLYSGKDNFVQSAFFSVRRCNNPEFIPLIIPLIDSDEHREKVFETLDNMDIIQVVPFLKKFIPKLKFKQLKHLENILTEKLKEMEKRFQEAKRKKANEEQQLWLAEKQNKLDEEKVMESSELREENPGLFFVLTVISAVYAIIVFYTTYSGEGIFGLKEKSGIVFASIFACFFAYKTIQAIRK